MSKKKGALELSFGMIFSIFLIIVFLAFAFYTIIKIVGLQKTIQIENFLRDFQNDVDNMWKSNSGSQNLVYSLPNNINAVCFKNDEFQNLEFSSNEIIKEKMIEHIDIEKTTKDESPLCIQTVKGKIALRIVKEYGETLVSVQK